MGIACILCLGTDCLHVDGVNQVKQHEISGHSPSTQEPTVADSVGDVIICLAQR